MLEMMAVFMLQDGDFELLCQPYAEDHYECLTRDQKYSSLCKLDEEGTPYCTEVFLVPQVSDNPIKDL